MTKAARDVFTPEPANLWKIDSNTMALTARLRVFKYLIRQIGFWCVIPFAAKIGSPSKIMIKQTHFSVQDN